MSLSLLGPYWRDDSELVTADGDFPVPIRDLLDVATEAYLRDRQDRRGSPGTPEWNRRLDLTVAVRRPALWNRREVREHLEALLGWLTGDEWKVRVARAATERTYRQMRLDTQEAPDDVVLFSGGLDATAGAALRMAEERRVLAVGVTTNDTMYGYQRRTYRALLQARPGLISYLQLPLESRTGSRHDEPSRRTRGFVFLAAGVAAATVAGSSELLLLENGIGAINLPYTAAQTGTMTSRSAHPRTLESFQYLCQLVLDQPVAVSNPHLFETKGQMCRALPDWAAGAVGSSESCDNAAAGRGALERRCGECASCLLRRVSLHAAGRGDWDDRRYRTDERGHRTDRDRTPEMLWQAARLQQTLHDLQSLQREFPEWLDLSEPLRESPRLTALFERYLAEWRMYPDPRVPAFLGPQPAGATRD